MAIAIISGKRTAFTKIGSSLKKIDAIKLGVKTVDALENEFHLGKSEEGLLVFGTVIQHASVSNIAREVALESKLHPQTRSFSVVKACATSLSALAEACSHIEKGNVKWAIAGGSESMSNFPVSFHKKVAAALRDFQYSKSMGEKIKALASISPNALLPQVPAVAERLTGLSMGEHCELMAKEWKIPREEQDLWAVQSHNNAFNHKADHEKFIIFEKDNLVRGDTSLERAAKLKPVFDPKNGTLTAANSSPLTDGAGAILIADEAYARKMGWPILALIDEFEMSAVDIRTEGLLMAPPYAILRMLHRKQKKLSDFDIFEIHEAFAAQVLCNLKALQDNSWCEKRVGLKPTTIPSRDRINPWGGSVALGHPFAATGARVIMQLAAQLHQEKLQSGLVSICAAGGIGMIASLKRV